MQSCQGVAWWAHRADAYMVRERSSRTCTESKTVIGSKDPHAFENSAPKGGIYTTENVASPFQAEPAHLPAAVSQRSLSDSLSLYQDTSTGIFFSKDLTPSLHQIARCPVPRWFQPLLDPPWRFPRAVK